MFVFSFLFFCLWYNLCDIVEISSERHKITEVFFSGNK